jgi:hypothetical protein
MTACPPLPASTGHCLSALSDIDDSLDIDLRTGIERLANACTVSSAWTSGWQEPAKSLAETAPTTLLEAESE